MSSWCHVLDQLANQLDAQEKALTAGRPVPPDLEIDPPDEPLTTTERIRAIQLFERSEGLLDLVADRFGRSQPHRPSPYRSAR